jgi:hypothetical protein
MVDSSKTGLGKVTKKKFLGLNRWGQIKGPRQKKHKKQNSKIKGLGAKKLGFRKHRLFVWPKILAYCFWGLSVPSQTLLWLRAPTAVPGFFPPTLVSATIFI